jgi:GTP pyrophosphokinase
MLILRISRSYKTILDTEGIDYVGRPKSIFEEKMKAQNVSFDEVYDKFALRIVYKSTHEEKFLAWKIYSIVTDLQTEPSRLRDSSPKSTGYEAHITVMGQKGRWVLKSSQV